MRIKFEQTVDFEKVIELLGLDSESNLFDDVWDNYTEQTDVIEFTPSIDYDNDDFLANHGMELITWKEEDTNSWCIDRHGNENDVAESIFAEYIGTSSLNQELSEELFKEIKRNLPYMERY